MTYEIVLGVKESTSTVMLTTFFLVRYSNMYNLLITISLAQIPKLIGVVAGIFWINFSQLDGDSVIVNSNFFAFNSSGMKAKFTKLVTCKYVEVGML